MIGELGALSLVVFTVGTTWATLLMYCSGYFIVPTIVKARCDGKEGRIPSVELESKRSSQGKFQRDPAFGHQRAGNDFTRVGTACTWPLRRRWRGETFARHARTQNDRGHLKGQCGVCAVLRGVLSRLRELPASRRNGARGREEAV